MVIHVVKEGDTLYSIAENYNTSIRRIRQDNALNDDQELLLGQSLLILNPEQVYTVRSGDTLYSISQNLGIDERQLLQNNPNITLNSTLYPNQSIILSYLGRKRGAILTNGYAYPFIDDAQLNQVLPYLSMITAFTYGITENGELIVPASEKMKESATEIGTQNVLLISTLDVSGKFNSELPGILFNNPVIYNQLLNNIMERAMEGKYRYIDIDFEFLPADQAENLVRFISDLRRLANPNGIKIIVALAPKTSSDQPGILYEGHRYRELGQAADLVLLMTYEWGYTYGPPQAVSPINKVRDVVIYATSEIQPNKILLGIPNYGYDWALPYKSGVSRATSLSNTDAILLAAQYRQQILFNPDAMTPYFYYTDPNGIRHVVWFEDARSILAKLNLISEFDLAGFSSWTVMRWFPALWLISNALFEIEE